MNLQVVGSAVKSAALTVMSAEEAGEPAHLPVRQL
jgi:hypothetical protein